MNKPRITTTIDYELIKLLKKQAKDKNISVSELVESIIDKSFFEEKTELKINEIDKKIDLTKEEIDKKIDTIKEEILAYQKNSVNILYHKLHKDYEELKNESKNLTNKKMV